jgi:hypothetical protein
MEGIPSKLQREWQRIGPTIFPKMKWRYERNYYEGDFTCLEENVGGINSKEESVKHL